MYPLSDPRLIRDMIDKRSDNDTDHHPEGRAHGHIMSALFGSFITVIAADPGKNSKQDDCFQTGPILNIPDPVKSDNSSSYKNQLYFIQFHFVEIETVQLKLILLILIQHKLIQLVKIKP